MKSSFLRTVLVGVIIIASVGTCFIGYRSYASRINQARVEHAESSADESAATIAALTATVNGYFTDENQQFITAGVTVDTINQGITQLNQILTSSSDFDISDSDSPSSLQDIANQKTALLALSQQALDKVRMQDSINALFSVAPSDWVNYAEGTVMRDDLTADEVAGVQAEVASFEDGAWKELANAYLNHVSEQVTTVDTIRAEFNNLMADGALINDADYDNYYSLQSSIGNVANTNIRGELEDQLATLLSLLGGSASSSSSSSSSLSDSSYGTSSSSTDYGTTYNY
ncbi:hypothetical protein [Enterococcus sp. HY326]|uniref:hypothetical protein n=1 Tax=Enterococcus sp. HY326 TaxID=2971265 RepID=UPI002240006B|nr:hypothetical protein [Enterococcus sp. HY326]